MVKPTRHLAAGFLVARQKWPGRARLTAGAVATMEDVFLCIGTGGRSASPAARGSLSQPAHPGQRAHICRLFVCPLSQEGEARRGQDAAMVVTAGLWNGAGSSRNVELHRAALVENLQPLNPPLRFGFKTGTYACTHANRNVIYRQICGALCVRGINSRRQIALRLC